MRAVIRRLRTFASVFALSLVSMLTLQGSGCASSDDAGAWVEDAGRDRELVIKEPEAGPWTPANVFPALWLDGDDAIEWHGIVTKWPDKSGNGNHAAQPQNVQPKVVEFNGHKAVAFDGNSRLEIKDALSLQWGTDDFAFFAVVRYTGVNDSSPANLGDIFVKNVAPEPYFGVHILVTKAMTTDAGSETSQFLMGTGVNRRVKSAKSEGYADGVPHVTTLRRMRDVIEMRVDFRVAGSLSAPIYDVSAVGADARIGAQTDGQFLQGDIATLIGVHGTVSDEDVVSVETYLKERYGP